MCFAMDAVRSYETSKPLVDRRERAVAALRDMSIWLDEHNTAKDPYAQRWERVGKVGEEFGEVVAAMIGISGQNPRKGVTHTYDDLVGELLDVMVTAAGAILHLEFNDPDVDPIAMLEEKILKVDARRRL